MKKAIIIGASSGIGKSLTATLVDNGYIVGITGRRTKLLEEIKKDLSPDKIFIKSFDATANNSGNELQELIDDMGGINLIIISAGTGFIDPDFLWKNEKATIDLNITAFAHMANIAYQHFKKQGNGHIVGISSISAYRGSSCPAYSASKAFVSNYLEGIRIKAFQSNLNIKVTDIKPGFVDTKMAQAGDGELFWISSPETAAKQIFNAIKSQNKHAYVTKRWRIFGWLLKITPEFLLRKYV